MLLSPIRALWGSGGGLSLALPGGRLVARLEYEAYTPLWPGGHDARGVRRLPGGGVLVEWPRAAQLVGRARWLLRAAACRDTHAGAEWRASRAFGSTEGASPFIVRLRFTPRVAGEDQLYIDSGAVGALGRAFDVLRRSGIDKKTEWTHVWQALEVEAYSRLRRLLGLPEAPRLGVRARERYSRVEGILRGLGDLQVLVAAVPRVYLALQGVSAWGAYESQPVRPRGVRAVVEVLLRPGARPPRETVVDAVASLAAVPVLLGLGKAATRGLGRLALRHYEPGEAGRRLGVDEVEPLVESLKRALDARGLREALERLRDTLKPPKPGPAPECPPLASARSLALEDPVHPCPYATQELGSGPLPGCFHDARRCSAIGDPELRTLCLLSAAGKAVLKSTWKRLHGPVYLRKPGVAYHTWPLGLPRAAGRGAGRKGYASLEFNEERYRRRGWDEGRIERVRRMIDEGEVYLGERLDSSEPRLQSPLHEAPAPGGGLLLTLYPYKGALANALDVLWHYGLHSHGTWHVVKVDKALTKNILDKIDDPSGIAMPDRKPGSLKASGRDVIERTGEALEAAWEWVVTLLSGAQP